MVRARTNVAEMEADLLAEVEKVREALKPYGEDSEAANAMCGIETFCAIALRVLKKTNPSKVRSEAMTLEIKCRMNGVPIV